MTTPKGRVASSSSVQVVVTNPIKKNGITKNVRTAKSTIMGKEQDTMIIRTVEAERAKLELKWVQNPSGKYDLVHVHCMKDHDLSEWKRTSGDRIEKLYDITQAKAGAWTICCKTCGRTWKSDASNRYLM